VTPQRKSEIQAALLEWFSRHGRRMPFRDTRDPYAVWISEIMLQQTTVAAVLPYWQRFMRRFPTVQALAAAPLEDVLHAWAGLGYYSRARNLHAAARRIMERHDAHFPSGLADILALPGVGRYTAGAIASIALGQDAPVVDANVARVLSRLELIGGDPKTGPAQRALWRAAEDLLPPGRAREWNLALFDLGATVCLPVNPQCLICPVRPGCAAFRAGRQNEFPQRTRPAPMTPQTDVAAVLRDDEGRVLMVRRPDKGVWAGMWELPRATLAEEEAPEAGVRRAVRDLLGVDATVGDLAAMLKHTVMRRAITLRAYRAAAAQPIFETESRRWISAEEAANLPVSSPQRRLLNVLFASEGSAE
jgi:A/G-specific adenine glycosylase